eukprot:Selendium_serpulae@DN6484_c4_g1_i4.p3
MRRPCSADTMTKSKSKGRRGADLRRCDTENAQPQNDTESTSCLEKETKSTSSLEMETKSTSIFEKENPQQQQPRVNGARRHPLPPPSSPALLTDSNNDGHPSLSRYIPPTY